MACASRPGNAKWCWRMSRRWPRMPPRSAGSAKACRVRSGACASPPPTRWPRKCCRRAPAISCAQNPGLTLQFLTSSENVKFSRWEADLAIRLRKPDKGDFAISKLGGRAPVFLRAGCDPMASRCVVRLSGRTRSDSRGAVPKRGCRRARAASPTISASSEPDPRHQAVGVLPEYSCADLLATAACAPRCCRSAATSGCWCRTTSSATPPRALAIDWVRNCFQESSRG